MAPALPAVALLAVQALLAPVAAGSKDPSLRWLEAPQGAQTPAFGGCEPLSLRGQSSWQPSPLVLMLGPQDPPHLGCLGSNAGGTGRFPPLPTQALRSTLHPWLCPRRPWQPLPPVRHG